MRRYLNLDTLDLQDRPDYAVPAQPLRMKHGTLQELEIMFVRNGVAELLTAGSTLKCTLKEQGKYDDDPIVDVADVWTTPGDDTGFYTTTINLTAAALTTLLLVNADPDDDPTEVTLMLEVAWYEPAAALPTKSNTIEVTLANDVGRDTDVSPAILPIRTALFGMLLTGFTGGGSTKLDGVDVSGMAVGSILEMVEATEGALSAWQLTAGKAITSSSIEAGALSTITAAAHGLAAGTTDIFISGHTGSTPTINGARTATYVGANTFTIPVDVTVAGTGGYFGPAENSAAGIVQPDTSSSGKYWTRIA